MVNLVRTATLLPQVLPFAPECPAFIAEQMIRFAAIELAERSRAWRHLAEVQIDQTAWQTLMTGTVGQDDYGLIFTVGGETYSAMTESHQPFTPPQTGLAAPNLAVIHEIEFAEMNGEPLTPIQFSTITSHGEGSARYITQVAPNALTVYPFQEGKLTVSMFLKPAGDSRFGADPSAPMADAFNVVPDFFVTMHGQALVYGALSKIFALPREPWTDDRKAAEHELRFREKLDGSFRQNLRGQQRAPIRTKPSWF